MGFKSWNLHEESRSVGHWQWALEGDNYPGFGHAVSALCPGHQLTT